MQIKPRINGPVWRRRATEQNHVLIQTMPPFPISSKAVTSGNTLRVAPSGWSSYTSSPDDNKPSLSISKHHSFWGLNLLVNPLHEGALFFSSSLFIFCGVLSPKGQAAKDLVSGQNYFKAAFPINHHKGNVVWRREPSSRSQKKNTVSTGVRVE